VRFPTLTFPRPTFRIPLEDGIWSSGPRLNLLSPSVFPFVSPSGPPQGQEGVKVQSPVAVAVGNVVSGSSLSPDQAGSVQNSSDHEGPPSKRLRRVACSCPNCRDGEGR